MVSGFWGQRRETNAKVSIPTLMQEFESRGIMDNFRRQSGKTQVARRGPRYTDSDVYKWLEAVAFQIQSEPNPKLKAMGEQVIEEILAAQQADGYINTYYEGEKRHTDMANGHELYCLGHLIQASIAWYRATSDAKLMNGAIRMIDYLQASFGPGKKVIYEGHPEIELALIELYRTTGEKRFFDFAKYLLDSDPRIELRPSQVQYLNVGKPFVTRDKLEGHAVRALYAASGATDLYLESGDATYWKTLQTLWEDLSDRKVYITGGVGARATGESFGEPYELPNQQAYTESCAAIASMMWNWRLLQATGEAKYADVMERALYNSVNSGMSLSGMQYCYRNPLEHTGNPEDKIRNPWYDTTCCPPNLERIFASLPSYMYSTSKDGLYVHLYNESRMSWRLEDGRKLDVVQKTEYPWKGEVRLELRPFEASEFSVFLRIPEWAEGTKVLINGRPAGDGKPGTYLELKRKWSLGDTVQLAFPMKPRLTAASARVRENMGKVAVERGPLVYCAEQLDQEAGTALNDLYLAARTPLREMEDKESMGGIVKLQGDAEAITSAGALYRRYGSGVGSGRKTKITLVPYYLFHNRGVVPMQVWIPVK